MLPELAHLGCGGEWPPDDVFAAAGVPGEEQTRLDPYGGAFWGCEPLGRVAALHGSPVFPDSPRPPGSAFWGLQALRGQCQACRELV